MSLQKTMENYTFQNLKLTDLILNKDNPRKATSKDMSWLVDSIKENGVLVPFIVKKQDNGYLILDGNHRYQAALMADIETVPAIILSEKLKKEQEYKLIFEINRRYADWDTDKINSILKKYEDFRDPLLLAKWNLKGLKLDVDLNTNEQMKVDVEKQKNVDKIMAIKAVVEKLLLDTEDQLEANYLCFARNTNNYMVLLIDEDTLARLRKARRDNPDNFVQYVISKLV